MSAVMSDRRTSWVRLVLSNGEALEAEPFTNRCDAEDPCNPKELKEKYFKLVEPISGHELAGNIYTLWSLGAPKNINQLAEKLS